MLHVVSPWQIRSQIFDPGCDEGDVGDEDKPAGAGATTAGATNGSPLARDGRGSARRLLCLLLTVTGFAAHNAPAPSA